MPITTQGKLYELNAYGKTDESIQKEFDNANHGYQKAKLKYKMSKTQYMEAQKNLQLAKERVKVAPISDKIKLKKEEKVAKKVLEVKKEQYLKYKEKLKEKLKELRELRVEIRQQYKFYKEYTKFFKSIKEAKKVGAELPSYVIEEYNNQKTKFLSENYSVDEKGKRNYIIQPNIQYTRDISELIWKKKNENLKGKVEEIKKEIGKFKGFIME